MSADILFILKLILLGLTLTAKFALLRLSLNLPNSLYKLLKLLNGDPSLGFKSKDFL